MQKVLFLILFTVNCSKNPAAPIHTPNSSSAVALNQSCANMQLVGTDTTLSIQPIQPVALANLTLKNVVIQGAVPFPGLPFHFLTLSADINDTMGGYGLFTIQSLAKSGTVQTEKVPSGVPRWVPNLEAGTYRVSVVPCNSLGCREDLVQKLEYLQQANDFPNLKAVSDTYNQCLGYIKQLQEAGDAIVKQSKSVGQYFAKDNELKLSGTSCANPLGEGQVAMNNINKLGAPYVGEILSNPDAISTEYNQLQLASENQKGTSTVTDTKTATATSSNDAAKTVLLSLGIVGVVGGLMVFVASVAHSTSAGGWTSLLNSSTPPAGVQTEGTVKEPVITAEVREKTPIEKTEAARVKSLKLSLAAGIGGALLAIGGAVAIGISQSQVMGLVGTDTEVDTGTETASKNPFDATANFITQTVLPLQRKLTECSASLNDKIAAVVAH